LNFACVFAGCVPTESRLVVGGTSVHIRLLSPRHSRLRKFRHYSRDASHIVYGAVLPVQDLKTFSFVI
jgi:hypothetical protein